MLRVLEAEGVPRADVVAVAHWALVAHVVAASETAVIVALRRRLLAGRLDPAALAALQTPNARYIRMLTDPIVATLAVVWDELRADGFDEDAAFERLWKSLDDASAHDVLDDLERSAN